MPAPLQEATLEQEQTRRLSGLVTMRMISIFSLLRRREILAHRQQFGLSEIEWHIMTLAGEQAPFSLSRLAALTLKDEGQLSRAVKKMTARGLVSRQRKPGGPEIEIGLSSDGWSVYHNMVERAVARDRWLTAEIVQEDLDALWRITDTMINKVHALMEDEAGPQG
jgi:DNA-binding MarR family transcriptional regulator